MTTFIGKGFGLPLRNGPRGLFQMLESYDLIDASIGAILSTRRGERWMLPRFGSDLWKLIFEPNDAVFEALAYHHVIDALEENEPRIDILAVVFQYSSSDMNRVDIIIRYKLKNTNSIRNRVYPFYRAGANAA